MNRPYNKAIGGGLATALVGLVASLPVQNALHALVVAVSSYVFGHALVWVFPANNSNTTNQG